jgi:hypothetical protein
LPPPLSSANNRLISSSMTIPTQSRASPRSLKRF